MNPAYETVLIDTKTGGPIEMPPVKKKVKIRPRKKRVNGKAPAILKADPIPKGLVHMGKSLRLDPARRATRVMEFIEHYCGLKLAPFQIDYLEDLYRTNPKTGNLVHSRAIYSTGRKCGKTALTASQILAGVVGPESQHRDRWHVETHRPTTTQSRDRILVVANSREQSRITFSAVQKMVEDNDTLKGIVDCVQSTLRVVHRNRLHYAEFLGHNPRTAQGYEPVAWYFEELGSARDSRLLEALDLSQGTVTDPIGVCVSTNSDFPGQPLFDLIEAIRKGQQQGLHKEWVLHVHAAGPKDDPWKKKTILKANPAIGHFASWDYYRKQRDLAKKMPSRRAAYEAFVLNRRYGIRDVLVNVFDWQSCADQSMSIAEFEGRECVIGLDLSLRQIDDRRDARVPAGGKRRGLVLVQRVLASARHLAGTSRVPQNSLSRLGGKGPAQHDQRKDARSRTDSGLSASGYRDVRRQIDKVRPAQIPRVRASAFGQGPGTSYGALLAEALHDGTCHREVHQSDSAGKLKHDDSPAANFCVANTVAVNKLMAGEHLVVPGKTQLGTTPAFLPNDACITMILALAVTKPPEEKPEPDTSFVSLKAELARLENGDA